MSCNAVSLEEYLRMFEFQRRDIYGISNVKSNKAVQVGPETIAEHGSRGDLAEHRPALMPA